MKLTLKIAKVLVQLINGEAIPASTAKSKLIDILISENIIFQKGRHQKSLHLINEIGLHTYLHNQLQINDLDKYISVLENESSSRADFVKITSDSKNSKERVFKGFLINSYDTIEAELDHSPLTIHPAIGSFVFIYDYETFKIPEGITIVGVENAENFRHIQEQKYLFEDINPLFVSRYPQNQSKDFIKWMTSISNDYMHFGDFDVAGIGIYLNEYKKHLSQRARFFIPKNIKSMLRENGNRKRFNKQSINFKIGDIQEPEIIALLNLIKLERKGLDQEYYIRITEN